MAAPRPPGCCRLPLSAQSDVLEPARRLSPTRFKGVGHDSQSVASAPHHPASVGQVASLVFP